MTERKPSEAERRLFGLMAVAEEQQAAVREAVAGLVAERAALERDRAQLARAAEALRGEAALVRRAAEGAGPGLVRGTAAAARAGVEASLAGAGATATAAVEAAARPLLEQLAGVAAQAGAVEASLRRVVGWASWRLLGRGAAVVAVLAGLLWLAHVSVWWWTARGVALAQANKAVLEAQIAELQATRDELARTGAQAKLSHCGKAERLCVRVDEAAGSFGEGSDYRVVQGY